MSGRVSKYFMKGLKNMLEIIQEAALPKLSQTNLFMKFDKTSGITADIKAELAGAASYTVKPQDIEELIALMKLNGDAIVKKAIAAYEKGSIIVLNNTSTSKIPAVLPFIVINTQRGPRAYVFANKCVSNIKSNNEYQNLMAVMEAAYLALILAVSPDKFCRNRQVMLILCNVYMQMAGAPLEQKLYMKGDNLTKALLYFISYFYKMADGKVDAKTLPYARLIRDKVPPEVVVQIVQEVNNTTTFMELLGHIKKINPVRYKNLDAVYLSHFNMCCGVTLIFALENLQYLFLLVTCANYKSGLTGYGLNKVVSLTTRRAIPLIVPMV
jgi:hypothetical protein